MRGNQYCEIFLWRTVTFLVILLNPGVCLGPFSYSFLLQPSAFSLLPRQRLGTTYCYNTAPLSIPIMFVLHRLCRHGSPLPARCSQSKANAGRAQACGHWAVAAMAETSSQQVTARHILRPCTASSLPILWLFSRNNNIIFWATKYFSFNNSGLPRLISVTTGNVLQC